MTRQCATRLLVTVLLLGGCSTSARSGNTGQNSRDILTHEQLAATNSGNLYDAIDKLRAEWLTSRGPTSVTDPTPTAVSVYMNGQMMGRAEALREVRVIDVTQVRFWPAGQAAARFGMGHPRGVIEIVRR